VASMEEQLGCQRLRSTTHVWLGSVAGYDECCRWRMMRYKGMDGPTNWSGRDIFRWLTSNNCSFSSRQTLYSYSSTVHYCTICRTREETGNMDAQNGLGRQPVVGARKGSLVRLT